MRDSGEDIRQAVLARKHLFADAALFIRGAQLEQMRETVAAVGRIAELPGWLPVGSGGVRARGVCFGYDFHLNAQGAHLIEINTNAGGAFLNAVLLRSQQNARLPGAPAALPELERVLVDMFMAEWRLMRGETPLRTIAILDEQPEQQYLYPEFLIAKRLFEDAGMSVIIADPAQIELRADGLYCAGGRVDLVYNRLTDFSLANHPALRSAHDSGLAVFTPHPQAYARYADKRNLARLSDVGGLRTLGAAETDVEVLRRYLPETLMLHEKDASRWWEERKQWFFKPATGYGAKAAYRGASLTRRVFEEILQGDYVAQRMAAPGERVLCPEGGEPVTLKSDVRCYVYDGEIQLVAARLYQGQTTNFRTPGGGFALVKVV